MIFKLPISNKNSRSNNGTGRISSHGLSLWERRGNSQVLIHWKCIATRMNYFCHLLFARTDNAASNRTPSSFSSHGRPMLRLQQCRNCSVADRSAITRSIFRVRSTEKITKKNDLSGKCAKVIIRIIDVTPC